MVASLKNPRFTEVRETYAGATCIVLIAPDPNAGLRHRYSVLRVEHGAGTLTCIGRELDLSTARRVARQAAEEPGCPGVMLKDSPYTTLSGYRHDPIGRRVKEARIAQRIKDIGPHCQATRDDGDCDWSGCPQLRDGEPRKNGRHCPLDRSPDEEG